MTKKELSRYIWIKKNIEVLESALAEIEKTLDNALQKYMAHEEREETIKKLAQQRIITEKKINKQIEKGLKQMRKIEKAIDELEEKEKLLMRLRYIEGKKWEEICYQLCYSWQHTHKLHGNILKKLRGD